MENYKTIAAFFEKILMMINLIENQTKQLEEKISAIRKMTETKNCYDDSLKILLCLKDKNEQLKHEISSLAFQITARDENIIEILDSVFLDHEKVNSLTATLLAEEILPKFNN